MGSKHSLLMKFGQFMLYYKRKNFIKKLYQNCCLKTSSRLFFVCKELSTTSIGKQATYIGYVIAKLSKSAQISMLTSLESFLQKILGKLKRPGTSLQATFFIEFFYKKFYFVILHKLAKFHYKTVYFPSYSVMCVSCVMLRHLITS